MATTAPATQPVVEPAAKTSRKKAAMTTGASPTAAPQASASPAHKTLADLFKPKSSPSPAAATAAAKTETVAKSAPAPGGGPGMVWVNTESKIYHKESSRFYGRTKKGQYMTEADAMKAGYKAAKGKD